MTRYKALIKTRQLWSYLAVHPDCLTKSNAYVTLKLSRDVNNCPCCEAVSYMTPTGIATRCEKCPLRDLWPNGCTRHDTPYYAWMTNVGTWEGTQAAWKIANAANFIINTEYPDEQT